MMFELSLNVCTSLGIGLHYIIEARSGKALDLFPCILYQCPDTRERNPPVQESFDCFFVRRIQNCRQNSTIFPGPSSKIESGKYVVAWFFKVETANFRKAQRLKRMRNSIRPGNRVLNWETHVGM